MAKRTIEGAGRVRIMVVPSWSTSGMMRDAQAADLREAFGLSRTCGELPVEGMGERVIAGVRCYIAPKLRKGRGHRIMAICPCGSHVPAGRLHQHKCKGAK